MGQPTSSIGQRVNRTQLAESMPLLEVVERGHAEHLFRLGLGARLAVLCFQSLFLPGKHSAWFYRQRRLRFYTGMRWARILRSFPSLYLRSIRRRYFFAKRERLLLHDGERAYHSMPFRRRRLRFATIFWCRPRFFRLGGAVVLVLRGYNVTARERRKPRVRRRLGGRLFLG